MQPPKRFYHIFFTSSTHKHIWALALPMILSNLSIPLVAFVDTMVVGRMPEASALASVAAGSSAYLFLVGCCIFLRMGTTGFTAQAVGNHDGIKLRQILLQSLSLSLIIALFLALLAPMYIQSALNIMGQNSILTASILSFFHCRLWALPATLLNFTLVGWFLGTQNARIPLMMLMLTNIINAGLSVFFVLVLHKGVVGAAQAAVIGEWFGAFLGLFLVYRRLQGVKGGWDLKPLMRWQTWLPLIFVNRDIFIRSLLLQAALFCVTIQGTRMGENIVAANVLILNGLMISAYLLDGFAHAIEALCGHAIGAKDKNRLWAVLVIAASYALVISLIFALIFMRFGDSFINLQTTLYAVRNTAYTLIPYLALLPLISVWGYLLDGLFIGATRAKEMRNAMGYAFIIALFLGYLLTPFGNHGLWITFLSFMALRGVFLSRAAWLLYKTHQWIV